jgi:hypothetical protein
LWSISQTKSFGNVDSFGENTGGFFCFYPESAWMWRYFDDMDLPKNIDRVNSRLMAVPKKIGLKSLLDFRPTCIFHTDTPNLES